MSGQGGDQNLSCLLYSLTNDCLAAERVEAIRFAETVLAETEDELLTTKALLLISIEFDFNVVLIAMVYLHVGYVIFTNFV